MFNSNINPGKGLLINFRKNTKLVLFLSIMYADFICHYKILNTEYRLTAVFQVRGHD